MSGVAAGDSRRALYYEWERAHWQAGAVDLTRDAAEFRAGGSSLEAVCDQVDCLHALARAVALACVPVADAVPDEEAQVLVTTQLADEARALVLFQRYLDEVAGRAPSDEPPAPVAAAARLVGVVASRIGRQSDHGELAAGVLILELVVQGALVATWQSLLCAGLDERGEQPGLREGLGLVAADRQRHTRFGTALLRELVASGDAQAGQLIARAATEIGPVVEPLRVADALWGPWVSPRELVDGVYARVRKLALSLAGSGSAA